MSPPKVSATELDWASARRAAAAIVGECSDAPFTAPEDTDRHQERLHAVCRLLDTIAAALRITPPRTP